MEDRILELKALGYDCGQIVMQIVGLDALGLEDENLTKAMCGMGYGMFCQSSCGAMTGAASALSLHAKDKQDTIQLVKALTAWFTEKFGTCEDILGPGVAPGPACINVVEETIEKCFELLEDRL